ncbi:MAG TPA: lytic transglycosylase domain-containing protein [Rhizomicrobium sp.]|nr:lytic transglycosylase domain-containing protein [Rhizomicrobium sp.]
MVNGRTRATAAFAAVLVLFAAAFAVVLMRPRPPAPVVAARITPVHHIAQIRTEKSAPRKAAKPAAAPAHAPSVFEQEQAMSPSYLMKRWDPFISEAARRFRFPAAWIRAAMRLESGGRTMLAENTPITSKAGAMGIMQLMPETWREMRAAYGLGNDPYDPHDSVMAGTAVLKILYARYGFPAMFAAYNAGPATLDAAQAGERTLPSETVAYMGGITRVLNGGSPGGGSGVKATLTRPNGSPAAIDVGAITAIRAPLPGEYADGVQAVISAGRMKQGVRETVAHATAIIRAHGGGV